MHRDPPSTESPEPYKRALSMWLQWNAAHEQLTARMFAAGQDQQALQDLLDELDRLRADAVAFSRELVD